MPEHSRRIEELEQLVRATLAPRYEVRRSVGRGAMATVFQARDTETGQDIAVKVLHRELAAALGGTRFQQEIRLLRALDHPSILPLIDSMEAGPLLYFTMPYVAGGSLRPLLDRTGPLPIPRTLAITRDIAAALDYAHARNVLHRDIKPENVLLDGDRAAVCDFGVARAIVRAGDDRISSSGVIIGTPYYMSPEQAGGRGELDARSDIYALGCLVYEMLTGEPPFSGHSAQAVFAKQLSERPRPIRLLRAEVHPGLETAVLRSLAKHPGERPTSAGALVGEMECWA